MIFNVVYIPDDPKIELEYLQIKYSFIPPSEVTAVFIRCKNNYPRADETIRDEYDSLIRKNWTKYQQFERKYGDFKHRYVVEQYKQSHTKYYTTSPSEEIDDTIDYDETPSKPMSCIIE